GPCRPGEAAPARDQPDAIHAAHAKHCERKAARQWAGRPIPEEPRSYQYPREENPRRASTRMTIKTIQRMLTLGTPLSWACRGGSRSVARQNAKEPPGGRLLCREGWDDPADPASSVALSSGLDATPGGLLGVWL